MQSLIPLIWVSKHNLYNIVQKKKILNHDFVDR